MSLTPTEAPMTPDPEVVKYAAALTRYARQTQRSTDRGKGGAEFWAFANQIADNYEGGYDFDKFHAQVFADYLQDHDNPLHQLVRKAQSSQQSRIDRIHNQIRPANPHPEFGELTPDDQLASGLIPHLDGKALVSPSTGNKTGHVVYALGHSRDGERGWAKGYGSPPDTKPILKLQIHIPKQFSTSGKARRADLTAPVTVAQYHEYVGSLPEGEEKTRLTETAKVNGWHKPETPDVPPPR